MNPKHALVALLIYAVALSVLLSTLEANYIREPQWLTVSTSLAFSLLMFWWYWLDSEARGYRRTPLLNVAVVALAIVAIPYYVVRSRERGTRLKAFAKCMGFGLLMVAALVLGGLPVMLLMSA